MKTLKKQKILRPTTGKVREALFDILRGSIEHARFLDLYAGTGAVGMNALAEGAAGVCFVEESKRNARRINELIKKNHISDKAELVTGKVISFIEKAELRGFSFEIIFLDPPYHTDEIILALKAIGESGIVQRDGIVVAEHFAKRVLSDMSGRLQKIKDYHYGDSVLSFYKVI